MFDVNLIEQARQLFDVIKLDSFSGGMYHHGATEANAARVRIYKTPDASENTAHNNDELKTIIKNYGG